MKQTTLKTCRLVSIVAVATALLYASVAIAKTKEELAAEFPNIAVEQLDDSPIPGLYRLRVGPDIAYIDSEGRYFLRGDIVNLESGVNVTEKHRAKARLLALEMIDPNDMIVYDAEKPEHWITVFTDVDCAFCRMFHQEIDEYTKRGIEVRYLVYPRTQPGSPSWIKAEQVMCSDDRHDALTTAKLGKGIDAEVCEVTAVRENVMMGQAMQLRATPAIVTDQGRVMYGYVSPDDLLTELNRTP
ncbi:MAG: DsbC family protein [Gammaproteobacteria bacterium]